MHKKNSLAQWIKHWRNIYGENPKFYECTRWYKNEYA